nr:hypothetical protein GCM10020185_63920 [Pseudomonas brassicacearum subsp. brassicacearum]
MLVITVVERPSIASIEIEGNKAISTEDLMKGLKQSGLAEGEIFQRATLEGVRNELQRQYVAQGRYSATVDTEVVPQPRNRVGLKVNINEGTVAAIQHINVVGNTVFPDEDLIDLFELKTTNWLSFFKNDDKYAREKNSPVTWSACVPTTWTAATSTWTSPRPRCPSPRTRSTSTSPSTSTKARSTPFVTSSSAAT